MIVDIFYVGTVIRYQFYFIFGRKKKFVTDGVQLGVCLDGLLDTQAVDLPLVGHVHALQVGGEVRVGHHRHVSLKPTIIYSYKSVIQVTLHE